MVIYKDKQYKFYEYFNTENGFLIRSESVDTKKNPIMRSFPELLDIGIMGTCAASNLNICKNFGVDCYQKAMAKKRPNIKLEEYETLLKQCNGKVFQIALGGAGDPNKHEDFKEILRMTRKNNIVPNYTTSGYMLTDDEAELTKLYCGAVAVSFYSKLINGNESNPYTLNAINMLLKHNCITNIHYVLSKQTISEAIYRLKNNLFPIGINAIIFLLYKPSGFGVQNKVLSCFDSELKELINIIDTQHFDYAIGFDTCFTPALLTFSKIISSKSLDFCEAARFSMYIDCELNAFPCSFDSCEKKYCVSLKNKSILDVWKSDVFEKFRNKQNPNCKSCKMYSDCLCGCPLYDSINICNRKGNQ